MFLELYLYRNKLLYKSHLLFKVYILNEMIPRLFLSKINIGKFY